MKLAIIIACLYSIFDLLYAEIYFMLGEMQKLINHLFNIIHKDTKYHAELLTKFTKMCNNLFKKETILIIPVIILKNSNSNVDFLFLILILVINSTSINNNYHNNSVKDFMQLTLTG